MRKILYWYMPAGAALIAAAVFVHGFYSFARGDTGTPVNIASPRRVAAAPPAGTIAPIILGDSLARGTGDQTGLGIGGRVVDDLRQRHIKTNNIVNLAINGARTGEDRKSTRLNSSHITISYAVFCLKKKKKTY